MTEPTAKLRLEATHVACGSPASAAAGTAVLSMFAALDVGRALHTANAEAAARQSSSHNGQRRVRAATGPGAVLATFATAAYLAIHTHATPRCRAGGRDFRRTTVTYANTAPEVVPQNHANRGRLGARAVPSLGRGGGRGAGSDSRRCPAALLLRVTGVKTHRGAGTYSRGPNVGTCAGGGLSERRTCRSSAPPRNASCRNARSPSGPPCFDSDRAASPPMPGVGELNIPHLGCGGRRVNYG